MLGFFMYFEFLSIFKLASKGLGEKSANKIWPFCSLETKFG
jgi:hypothetical protein